VAAVRFALALALAGCLSEPSRPHGIGPPVAPGSVLRRELVAGDVDGDGYDDIVVWGNESAPGTNPTVFVYFGGETLENPDVRLDLTTDDPDAPFRAARFEVLAVSLYTASDGSERGLGVLSAQDSDTGTRSLYLSYYQAEHRGFAARVRNGVRLGAIGGFADRPAPVFVSVRDPVNVPPLREYAAGDDTPFVCGGPLEPSDPCSQAGYWNIEQYEGVQHYMQHVFVLPPEAGAQSESLLLVTRARAYRIGSDGPIYEPTSAGAMFSDGPQDRNVRGGRVGDHFYAITDAANASGTLSIVDVPAGGEPIAYALSSKSGLQPTEIAIGDVDGNATVDVVTLEGQALALYRDVALDPSNSQYTLISPRTSFDNYDLLAIGNFHGDARREIYALDSGDPTQPPRCFRLTGATLAPCTGE
jgi:hypothetical protein